MKKPDIKKLSNQITKTVSQINEDKEIEDLQIKGFKYVSSGVSRYVFLHESKRFVLKIEDINQEYEQNKKEIQCYESLPQKLKRYFAKPIAYAKDYSWILMMRAKTNNDLPNSEIYDIMNSLQRILNENNFWVGDLHTDNVGKIGKQYVLVDYGYGMYSQDEITQRNGKKTESS